MEVSTNLQSNLNYEDCQPKLEIMETPESHIMLVHLPGYAEDDIGAHFEYDYRRVRVFGGRSLGDNRSIRFNIVYAVPWNCDVNNLKGMFQGENYSVIMPKATISSEVSDKNAPKSISDDERDEMETCEEPKSIIEDQKYVDEALTAPKATSDSMPQKGEEGTSQDAKNQTREIFESGEKKRVESGNACESGKPPQKGERENVMDETSFITENGKGKGKEKVEINDVESPKGKGKKKVEHVMDETSFITENGKGKGKEKMEMNDVGSSKGKGIKKVADSASHVVTSLVKRFNEEDMHVLLYASATVLTLALGVYVSYKVRSSARQ
ncbi:hypothetical protein VNO78_07321 [Psophocarpus tetragonolobus]|uniref:SHSP domain-containing protein n=1 Tax=Psophocarpus tetragonolobus TaxID=3891 RepID=A0AAN9XS01_PSOTE